MKTTHYTELSKSIREQIRPLNDNFFPNITTEILEINNVYLRFKKNSFTNNDWLFGYSVVSIFFGGIFAISFIHYNVYFSVITGLLLLLSLIYVTAVRYRSSKGKLPYDCEFNRLEGTITYTQHKYWGLIEVINTVSFFDCSFRLTKTLTITPGKTSSEIVADFWSFEMKPSIRRVMRFVPEAQSNCRKFHSFLCWYMDKNRPLPPGTMLNPYRHKDFIRRKEEGLEEPLIPSLVKMVEVDGSQCKENLHLYQQMVTEINSDIDKIRTSLNLDK